MINPTRYLYLPQAGTTLLAQPLLNKGSAFSVQERIDFNLHGLIPHTVETIADQVDRAHQQFADFKKPLDKHIYLRAIQDKNETLYFALLRKYLKEMLPIVYTPTVGAACKAFSNIYRSNRGLFLDYPNRDHMERMLRNVTKNNIQVIVVTDGERILGLGDLGIGGMGISIGKLSLYSLCGGISPAHTLPIVLDVGTNNKELLNDSRYMGWRHLRIEEAKYHEFIDLFMKTVRQVWPKCLIQFEDFASKHAQPLLERYRNQALSFNDDIQGTASVTAGALLTACARTTMELQQHRFVFAGAGSAGCGIAAQLISHLQDAGLTAEQALQRVFVVNRRGLLDETMDLYAYQQRFIHPQAWHSDWERASAHFSLKEVVLQAKATVLIGVSGQSGVFDELLVKMMAKHVEKPIIFPLSNPTSQAEALPSDLLQWTNGTALIATGSPFDPVEYAGKTYEIAQCNNVYIFPSIGLGALACGANKITDGMFKVASVALAQAAPVTKDGSTQLLPDLDDIVLVCKKIALAVALQAVADGCAPPQNAEQLRNNIARVFWTPQYRNYRRTGY